MATLILRLIKPEYNNKNVLLRVTVHQISRGESAGVWRNYTVLFLSRDVKNSKFNQYLTVDLTSLDVSNSRFRKPVLFWSDVAMA